MFQYAWFIWSLFLLLIWLILYLSLKDEQSKKEMLIVSLWTSLFGLTEPLFVPEYWTPTSLFNLAQNTGFDIESLIFSFGIGGIAAIIYETIFSVKHKKLHKKKYKYYRLMLLLGPSLFIILLISTPLNPIYDVFISLIFAGLLTWYYRPDLKKKMIWSGLLFTIFYLLYFYFLILFFPGYVEKFWNLQALSGIMLLKIPIEELIFAFTFGFYWSSIYEYIKYQKITKI